MRFNQFILKTALFKLDYINLEYFKNYLQLHSIIIKNLNNDNHDLHT